MHKLLSLADDSSFSTTKIPESLKEIFYCYIFRDYHYKIFNLRFFFISERFEIYSPKALRF